jgi:AraC-like DNA-binding protein
VITLLQPGPHSSKSVSGAGSWSVRHSGSARPFYSAILDGECRLVANQHAPMVLRKGDFLLIPSAQRVEISSLVPAQTASGMPVPLPNGEYRHGTPDGPADVRSQIGYCRFGSPDADLLVSLLPERVYIRGEQRLATLAQMVGEESRARRPAREGVLARLLEVLLIEALRSGAATGASTGLLRGMADERLAGAIRRMHESPAQPWTVAQLAKEAALSRSAFFERFNRTVGVAPMEYLLAWRMSLARSLLCSGKGSTEVAERVGYSSASTFSSAFTRHVGMPPARYAREHLIRTAAEAQAPGTCNSVARNGRAAQVRVCQDDETPA